MRENGLTLACFLLGILVVWSQLHYPSHWLNEWDESQYINSGRMLSEGKLPVFALSPLLAFFYYPLYELLKNQPMWLFEVATFGHRILFVGLWGVLWLVGKELFDKKERAVMLVWPIVTAAFAGLATNSSDAMFAIFSGLAFWQVLRFRHSNSLWNAGLSGVFMALATLSRVEGLYLEPIIAVIFLSYLYKRNKLKLTPQIQAAALLPFFAVLSLELGIQNRMIGSSDMGLQPRTYVAFEQGQGIVYADRFKSQNPMTVGVDWCQKLYGSAKQNRQSIMAAAAKNPTAFLDRIEHQAEIAPRQALSAYSDPSVTDRNGSLVPGVVLLACVVAGICFLIRERKRGELGICLTWLGFLVIYVVTFFQPGYFLMACFPIFTLAGYGLVSMIRVFETRTSKGQFAPVAVTLACLTFGIAAGSGRGIPQPRTYQITEAQLRSAVEAIQHGAPDSGVVSSAPQLAYLAKRNWINPATAPHSPAHLKAWVKDGKAKTVIIDGRMKYDDPGLYSAMGKVAPKVGKQILNSGEDLRVYKVAKGQLVAAASAKKPKKVRHVRRRKDSLPRHY